MPKTKENSKHKIVKIERPDRPDLQFFLIEPEKKVIEQLAKPILLPQTCSKACTKVITLLPETEMDPGNGVGYQMINVDGFRSLNAYVISDRLNSSNNRGFTLEISFSLFPFVYGVGVVGESDFFFNFDTYYDPSTSEHRLIRCMTSDRIAGGGIPRIGGVDLSHILRVPVMGPYVRASVINRDSVARSARVEAYLST